MQGHFKKYAREQRTQVTEEMFKAGMSFTNAPLTEGVVKELVNYDMQSDGQALVPRPGVRAYSCGINTVDALPFTDKLMIASGKQFVELDSMRYAQLILGEVEETLIPDTTLHTGKSIISTVQETPHSTVTLPELQTTQMFFSGVDDLYRFPFIKPGKASIHNIPLVDTASIARQVGTFGFNNSYYSFGTKEDTIKLCQTKFNKEAKKYEYEELTPKELTPKEAVMWGYNMLADKPYHFECRKTAVLINLLGMLPYDKTTDELIMTPVQNQTLNLKCYYTTDGKSYKVKWDYKEVNTSDWTVIKEETVDTSKLLPLTAELSPPAKEIIIRVTVFKTTENPDQPVQVLSVGFNFDKEDYGSTANINAKKYSITKCSGLTYWKNRLIAYGVPEDPSILFMGEINDPTYFPFPQSSDIFDEPIIHVIPFLENLLVFTATHLYMITLGEDGYSFTKKLIQSNLTIEPWDLHLIKIVKNMVFFKSGNYYYMVVPKLNSMTGELVIAPISKSIAPFLDNFKQNVENTIKTLYNYSKGLTLVHYYNYLDFEDVHNVYVFKTDKGVYLNYVLLYNSITRCWRSYVFESKSVVQPYKQDATKKGILMSLFDYNGSTAVQFLKFDSSNISDYYYSSVPVFFKNYQFLDTGYREHSSDYNKRYRELQLKINNLSQQPLKFYTEFVIDGELRKAFTKYSVVHNVDKLSPDYGVLSLERTFIDPSILPSMTVLAETNTDDNYWVLDSSLFPDAMMWKVRIPVSGKGYAPRMSIVSMNEQPYELLNTAWVFRLLNSR